MADEHKTKILMLDDEKFLLDIYKLAFEKNDYEVTDVHSVEDALNVLRGGYDPDVMLFDINMPEKSGYEFLETVVREGLGKRSLKVALTNEAQDGAMARIAELGADAQLIKSDYIPSEVVSSVEQLLDMKRSA